MTDNDAELLKRKSAEYVSSMEKGSGLDYDDVPTDTLLVLEAFNDWSAGALAERGAIKTIDGDRTAKAGRAWARAHDADAEHRPALWVVRSPGRRPR